jgi:hypothetical protein
MWRGGYKDNIHVISITSIFYNAQKSESSGFLTWNFLCILKKRWGSLLHCIVLEGLDQKAHVAHVRLLEIHITIEESETLADNFQLVDTSRYKSSQGSYPAG